MDKIIPQSIRDKPFGTILAWFSSLFIGVSMVVTMFGAFISYIVQASANDIFDAMLLDRGISKETFDSLKKDTAELKADVGSIKGSIGNINNTLTLQAQSFEHAEADRTDLKKQVDKLVDKLIQE